MDTKPIEILLVEDNEDHALLTTRALKKTDFLSNINVVQDGQDAIDYLYKKWKYQDEKKYPHPDVVLLDYTLGDSDGIAVLKEIKGDYGDIPVIMVTGMRDESIAVESMKLGAYDYIVKSTGYLDILPVTVKKAIEYKHNISKRRKAEAEVRRQNEFLKIVLESLTHPFYVIDANDYTIKIANNASNAGGLSDNLTCHELTHLSPIPCKDEEHICPLKEVKKTKKPATTEHVHYDKNGNARDVEVHCYPIFDNNGNVTEAIEYCLDITERNKSEDEKKRLQAQLVQAQKMEAIGTLASGIAHDFNNILFPIMGYTEMTMAGVPSNSKEHSHLEKVLIATDRAKELVMQIITFGNRSEQEKVPVNVQAVIKEVLKLLKVSLPTTIEIVQNIKSDCMEVIGNPVQIHQVMMNLCTNAYHAMREGGVLTVSLTEIDILSDNENTIDDLKPGGYLLLSVNDTGHGIEPLIMDRMFEPYFTTKKTGEGSGLGLSVVHGIVKGYGGDITVSTETDKGTTFNVYLPLVDGTSRAQVNATNDFLPRGDERILIIDDDENIVEVLEQMLHDLGYHVTSKTSSVEALEAFRAHPDSFDLVITDMTMPKMTGDRLAKEIVDIRSDIPIILCSGYIELMTKEKAREIGIRDVVSKPLAIQDLFRIIRRALEEKGLQH